MQNSMSTMMPRASFHMPINPACCTGQQRREVLTVGLAVQVLQLSLASVYGLVALCTAAGWLPAGCFGALCLASPVVSTCLLLLFIVTCEHQFVHCTSIQVDNACTCYHARFAVICSVKASAPQLCCHSAFCATAANRAQ